MPSQHDFFRAASTRRILASSPRWPAIMDRQQIPVSAYESPWMNDEVRMFRKTVSQFVQKEFAPYQARWREQRGPDADAWTNAGRAGILLPDLPEQYGGGGGTFAHEAVVLEELAKAGVHFGSAIQSTVAHYILAYGSEAQKRNWLPRLARGERVAAIAMSEPGAGSDLQAIKTSARRDGEHYVIQGSKTFITNGSQDRKSTRLNSSHGYIS